jgi:hypothetical protein
MGKKIEEIFQLDLDFVGLCSFYNFIAPYIVEA